nr:glycosyltransferase family 4 protein [Cupriavidus basilensis]
MRSGVEASRLSYLANFSPRSSTLGEEVGNYTDSNRQFIFLGRLSEEKGIFVLLAAAKLVPDATVLIVGDGPMRAEIASIIKRDGISNVRLTGHLNGDKLREVIGESRALIIPSTCFETAPLVIIEAYQAGIPVIGANRGGISEMVLDEETGYLFEAENPKALADCMTKLLAVKGLSEALGANGNKWGRQFEEGEHTDSLLRFYLQ